MKLELNHKMNYIKQYKVTLNDVLIEWLVLEANYKYQENTIIDYKKRYYKHIYHKLGNILVCELDYVKLQSYFNENIEIGYSINYKLREILNVLLNFSIKCNYIDYNPLKLIHIVGNSNTRTKNKVCNNNDFDNIINELLKNLHISVIHI